ncbi:hypothetical protein AB1Y20_008515 [Prymnesium parvum]|uniref:Uncharacterized protein n=1 Tax=Prymnesium parvum TaxID=97485 RepID=A0AB34ITC9_PRYPA
MSTFLDITAPSTLATVWGGKATINRGTPQSTRKPKPSARCRITPMARSAMRNVLGTVMEQEIANPCGGILQWEIAAHIAELRICGFHQKSLQNDLTLLYEDMKLNSLPYGCDGADGACLVAKVLFGEDIPSKTLDVVDMCVPGSASASICERVALKVGKRLESKWARVRSREEECGEEECGEEECGEEECGESGGLLQGLRKERLRKRKAKEERRKILQPALDAPDVPKDAAHEP